jgi:hypothetical protein
MAGQLGFQFQGAIRSSVLLGADGRCLNVRGLAQKAFEGDFHFSRHLLLQLNNSLLNLNIFQQSGAGGFGRMIGSAIAS